MDDIENTASEVRIDERVEYNAVTGAVEYRSWTDADGVLHEEYPEVELTDEQRARLDRFSGPMMEPVKDYMERRQAQTAARRKSRAKKAAAPQTPEAD